jgi:hypothetical protein
MRWGGVSGRNRAFANQRSEARNPEGTDFTCETNSYQTTSSFFEYKSGLDRLGHPDIPQGQITWKKLKSNIK